MNIFHTINLMFLSLLLGIHVGMLLLNIIYGKNKLIKMNLFCVGGMFLLVFLAFIVYKFAG